MLEKHIQLMHGIKDPDVKEMTESTNMEEREVKEDTKVITWNIQSVSEFFVGIHSGSLNRCRHFDPIKV